MKFHQSLIVPKALSDIYKWLHGCCERQCGRIQGTEADASEILITLKRDQRPNRRIISHLREPGTASSNGQEQNGFHLASVSATIGDCMGNTSESISQLFNVQKCQLALARPTDEEPLHF